MDFLNASRFPVRDRAAMSFKHQVGNLMLSLAMSLLFFRWVRDSQSGMWVFRRSILKEMKLESDGMAFSEEIKIEALRHAGIRFGEISIQYSSRLGEMKLNPWRDGFQNLWFLVKKRFGSEMSGRRSPSSSRSGTAASCWRRLLGSLRAQTHPIAEMLVVDNGSTDGSAEAAEQAGARVLRMGANLGFARAVNRGIAECRTEWLAIVNNDVEAGARLAGAARRRSATTATPGSPPGRFCRRRTASRIDGTFDALSRGGCAWRVGTRPARRPGILRAPPHLLSRPAPPRCFAPICSAASGRSTRPSNRTSKTSISGCAARWRASSGWYVPEAVAWHRGSATLGRWNPQTVRRISRNQVFLVAKHYPARLILRYAWPILVAQGLWGLRGAAARRRLGLAARKGRRSVSGRRGDVRKSSTRLRAILEQSEREILHIQSKTGFDFYWRVYFLLTRGGAS